MTKTINSAINPANGTVLCFRFRLLIKKTKRENIVAATKSTINVSVGNPKLSA
ncbi:hypothetical protein LV716_18400 [Flagellimonas sp. HMM57]|uniref:hypothetical protein n=1 Tax=Flagellimonas sp. HMM57 TaxID=2905121 RepID=UPI001F35E614|nr:hypothetical protein [Flagellimonas sp. HMM57]UII76210.1 hypothetical protein LV716_18400 [Flagellimonas sp. HMM57]